MEKQNFNQLCVLVDCSILSSTSCVSNTWMIKLILVYPFKNGETSRKWCQKYNQHAERGNLPIKTHKNHPSKMNFISLKAFAAFMESMKLFYFVYANLSTGLTANCTTAWNLWHLCMCLDKTLSLGSKQYQKCTKKFCTDLENMTFSCGIHDLMEMGCKYFPLNETFVFMAIFG